MEKGNNFVRRFIDFLFVSLIFIGAFFILKPNLVSNPTVSQVVVSLFVVLVLFGFLISILKGGALTVAGEKGDIVFDLEESGIDSILEEKTVFWRIGLLLACFKLIHVPKSGEIDVIKKVGFNEYKRISIDSSVIITTDNAGQIISQFPDPENWASHAEEKIISLLLKDEEFAALCVDDRDQRKHKFQSKFNELFPRCNIVISHVACTNW